MPLRNRSGTDGLSGRWLLSRRLTGMAGLIGPAVLTIGPWSNGPRALYAAFSIFCAALAIVATLMAVVSWLCDRDNKFDGRPGYMTRRHYNSLALGLWFSAAAVAIGYSAA